jgi:DhnA family fructose-bisphosphate aldolase class Ia
MAYARGPGIGEYDHASVAHAVRVAVELGADIVKCNFTDDVEAFHRMVDMSPVPIIVAGGPQMDTTYELFRLIATAMDAGASGVAVGRNIFGDPCPGMVARQIVRLVHAGISAEEAEDALLVQTAAGLFDRQVVGLR